MSSDAIVFLKEEHKQMKRVFREFEKNKTDAGRRGEIVRRMIELLTIHTYLENEIMYPEVRRLLPQIEDDVLESYEEHHVADVLCQELWSMDPAEDHYPAKTTVLIENVEHHMEEEEQEWFPKVREGVGRKSLQDMGQRMIDRRPSAPRTPTEPEALKKAMDAVRA
jgi:iron-sulfur cluster repair protein YtfE (RIC family)